MSTGQLTTMTWHFPEGTSPEDQQKIVQADLARMHAEREKERWFQDEVRRRGLDQGGMLSGLLPGIF